MALCKHNCYRTKLHRLICTYQWTILVFEISHIYSEMCHSKKVLRFFRNGILGLKTDRIIMVLDLEGTINIYLWLPSFPFCCMCLLLSKCFHFQILLLYNLNHFPFLYPNWSLSRYLILKYCTNFTYLNWYLQIYHFMITFS